MKKRVLVADDSAVARMLIRRMIDSSEYDVEEASDGVEASFSIRSGNFDIVLLDLLMPHMTGIDVLKAIIDMDDAPRVIVLSSDDQEETVTRCLKLGAEAYLHKPVNGRDVARALKERANVVG